MSCELLNALVSMTHIRSDAEPKNSQLGMEKVRHVIQKVTNAVQERVAYEAEAQLDMRKMMAQAQLSEAELLKKKAKEVRSQPTVPAS